MQTYGIIFANPKKTVFLQPIIYISLRCCIFVEIKKPMMFLIVLNININKINQIIMNAKVKKGLKITVSVLVVFFAILLVLPFAFSGKITKLAKEQINGKLNATVDFDKINLSFIRHFPFATVSMENLRIVGINEFKKDTLFSSEDVDLVLNISSLFSDKGYEIRKLQINNSRILAHVLPNGKNNWTVTKTDSTQKNDTTPMSFNMKLKDFEINKAYIVYWDEQGKQKAVIHNLNHRTSGDFTADSSMLKTKTTIDSLDYWMGGVKYLSKADIELNANIDANLNKKIYKFKDNLLRLNAIQLSFAGWLKMLDDGYDMDLTLDAKKVDFKAILSLIPAIYANSFEGLKAGGAVNLTGFLKGKMVGDNYPAFDFKLTAVNGWFQYPKLPKSVQNINIAADISNPGKTLDATVVDVSKFAFTLGGNPFSAQMRVAYPMSDPELTMKAVGKLDLGNIKEIYPLEAGTQLNGVLDMNLDLGGRMSYYDKNQYDKFKFGGKLNISNMLVKMKASPQDISITKANMVFNNQYADLSTLQMKLGRNDLTMSGRLENFVAYALHDKTLTGSLNMQSNYFNVSYFMTGDSKKATTDTAKMTLIKIPKNINFTMKADFKKLIYSKMDFSNAKGTLLVANGDMKIQNMSLQAFGGSMLMNGLYSTADVKKPYVNFDINLTDVTFTEMFKQVETLQKFAPIFEKASGKFSSKLSVNSRLNNDMMPNMASLIGNGSFSTKSIGLSNVEVINALASKLNRSGLSSSTIKDLAFNFDIKDGKVNTKPFDVALGNIKMKLGGSTGLDKTIAYTGIVQLPDQFNLGKLSTLNLKIGGTFSNPKVQVDMMSMLNNVLSDTKAKAISTVNSKIDAAKPNAIKAVQDQADQIRGEAKKVGDQLISEAKTQGDQLVAKASNPLTKIFAQKAAQKLLDEAQKKSDDLNAKADAKAKELIQKASGNAKL